MSPEMHDTTVILASILLLQMHCLATPGEAGEAFKPDKSVSRLNDAMWATMLSELKNYPAMPLEPEQNRLLVQMARERHKLFLGTSWELGNGEGSRPQEFFLQEKELGYQVTILLLIGENARRQMQRTMEDSFESFMSSARASTWRHERVAAGDWLRIPGAEFVAHYAPAKGVGNKVYLSVGNVQMRLRTIDREVKAITPDEELVKMAARFTGLFEVPEKVKVEPAPENEMLLKLKTCAAGQATVTWSVAGALKESWVRVDTTAGELSIDHSAPGVVTIAKMPQEGAKVTCYAISPDGTKWCSRELAISKSADDDKAGE